MKGRTPLGKSLQDLILFDLNTGLRTGELFTLKWSDAKMEDNILNVIAPKTQKIRAVPINSGLLGHSSVTVTMRYTHTNLASKHAAVAKLEDFGDSLVAVCTKLQQPKDKLSLKAGISYNVSAG